MWRTDRMIQSAIDGLATKGVVIDRADDMPGLFNIRGGPEITVGQLMDLCRQNGITATADYPDPADRWNGWPNPSPQS